MPAKQQPPPPPPWWQPPALPPSPRDLLPTRGAWPALRRAAELALANAWALAALGVARDSVTFLLHRLSQRATNEAAALLLLGGAGGGGAATLIAPNPWWLCLDAAFLQANPGYQALVALFFALALPLNVAVNAAAAAAAVVLCTSRRGAGGALLLPRRPAARAAAAAAGAAASSSPGKWRRRKAAARPGALAVGPGAWWAAEPWRQAGHGGGPGRAGAGSFSAAPVSRGGGSGGSGGSGGASASASASGAGRSGAASFASSPRPTQHQQLPTATAWPPRLPAARLPLGPLRGPLRGLAAALEACRCVLATPGLLRRAWLADLWVSAQSVPLQALALAVAPAPWAVPRLLAIQLAVPAAVLRRPEEEAVEARAEAEARAAAAAAAGANGAARVVKVPLAALRAAVASARRPVARSATLMHGFRTAYAWPFVAAYAAGRLVEAARDGALAAFPARWWADVPELPLAAAAFFLALGFLVARAAELLPLAVFLERTAAVPEAEVRAREREALARGPFGRRHGGSADGGDDDARRSPPPSAGDGAAKAASAKAT